MVHQQCSQTLRRLSYCPVADWARSRVRISRDFSTVCNSTLQIPSTTAIPSMASSKRQSVLPRGQVGPKAPVNFSSSLTIADTAVLTGNHTINISSESVVHPRARFDSSRGRVTIGRRNIIHERASIGVAEPNQPSAPFGVLTEDYVTIEVSAIVESGETTIGEGTLIGIGAKIGRGAKIGKVRRRCLMWSPSQR